MNEAETRAEHIDPALKAAGWGVANATLRIMCWNIAIPNLPSSKPNRGIVR